MVAGIYISGVCDGIYTRVYMQRKKKGSRAVGESSAAL